MKNSISVSNRVHFVKEDCNYFADIKNKYDILSKRLIEVKIKILCHHFDILIIDCLFNLALH